MSKNTERLNTLKRCDCGSVADVAINGKPECPKCIAKRDDNTGSWSITSQNSKRRVRKALFPTPKEWVRGVSDD